MIRRSYLRPTAFVDSPVHFDGQVARLAGGLCWFAAVEVVTVEGATMVSRQLVPVSEIDEKIDEIELRETWQRIVGARSSLSIGARTIRLDQPLVVGIVNATPDSFSDGGKFKDDPFVAAEAGFAMSAAGAAIIDVGGESTRPGAKPVWEGDEIERVAPIIRKLAASGTAVSIDTRKAAVMEAALGAGAGLINDVSALTYDERALEVVARAGCPVILMHHQGTPEIMQLSPHYDAPVLYAVYDWLEARIEAAISAGISRDRIIVDPGIGFGKTVQHNLSLMNGLAIFHGLGCPIMLGASRKRLIGALSGEAQADQRLGGSLALALKSAEQGVQLLRVHDVPETVQALNVWRGLRDAALTNTLISSD